jgi:predicted RNA-binding Zn ribbon-like protein
VTPNYTFQFVGGALCLDFVNTVGGRKNPKPDEHLNDYEDLVEWARQGGVISDARAKQLIAQAAKHPNTARRVLAEALALREAIARISEALLGGKKPPAADLALLNATLPRALAHLEIVPSDHGFDWRFREVNDALDAPLWPAVRSAADLLLHAPPRVGICESPTCGWLFVDTSRNHSRRWCDMGDCGNRAKARRHYSRQRGRSLRSPGSD